MAQFEQLKNDYKNAKELFNEGVNNLRYDFQEHQKEETGRVSLDDG